MACPIGTKEATDLGAWWKWATTEGGFSETDARALLGEMKDSNSISRAMSKDGDSVIQKELVANSDYGTQQTAVAAGLQNGLTIGDMVKNTGKTGPELLELAGGKKQEAFNTWMNQAPKDAWKAGGYAEKSSYVTSSGKSLDTLHNETGETKETILGSVSDNKKNELVTQDVMAHPETAKQYQQGYYNAVNAAINTLVSKDKGTTAIEKINNVSRTTGLKAKDVYNAAPATQTEIKEYYSNPRNVDPRIIVNKGQYRIWTDEFDNGHSLAITDGAIMYNPVTGKMDPTLKGNVQDANAKGYKTAEYSPQLDKYWDEVVIGGKDPATWLGDPHKDMTNWTCVGTGCPGTAATGDSSSGGSKGGGGGSSSGGGSAKAAAPNTGGIYVETDPASCEIWKDGEKIGMSEQQIILAPGSYTIEIRKDGYETTSRAVTVKTYMVNVTVTLTAKKPGISKFIKDLGGLGALNQNAYLYLYCTYKARVTGAFDWKTLGATTGLTTEVPLALKADDILYAYYLVIGDPASAAQLVTDGKVTLEVVE